MHLFIKYNYMLNMGKYGLEHLHGVAVFNKYTQWEI